MTTADLYQLLRRIFGAAFLTALIGAALAFSVGNNTDMLRGKIGAIIVAIALAVMFLITPIGFVVAFRGAWKDHQRSRRELTEGQERNTRLERQKTNPRRENDA
jgi:hypothetical protein